MRMCVFGRWWLSMACARVCVRSDTTRGEYSGRYENRRRARGKEVRLAGWYRENGGGCERKELGVWWVEWWRRGGSVSRCAQQRMVVCISLCRLYADSTRTPMRTMRPIGVGRLYMNHCTPDPPNSSLNRPK
jgi:hypothetical protein